MFKVNNKNTNVFTINFEHISDLILVFQFLTLSKEMLAELLLRRAKFTFINGTKFCYLSDTILNIYFTK